MGVVLDTGADRSIILGFKRSVQARHLLRGFVASDMRISIRLAQDK